MIASKLFVIVYVLLMALSLFGAIIYFNNGNTDDAIVDCYDGKGNVINGVTCTDSGSEEYFFLAGIFVLLVAGFPPVYLMWGDW